MCEQTGHNEVIVQLGKHFNSYRRESHGLFYTLIYSKFAVVFLLVLSTYKNKWNHFILNPNE